MVSFPQDEPIIFLLGAGFCVDAASEAGNPLGVQGPAKYPLVSELLKICFGMDSMPSNKSIEDLFQESIDNRDIEPRKVLYETLMEADYYISSHLMEDGSHRDNAYMRFLNDFPLTSLLTFNYDSLPEILLLSEKVWRPEDGYGMPVKTQLGFDETSLPERSKRVVLHLHGTLCVYADEFDTVYRPGSIYGELREKERPDYIFDPDLLGHRFFPFDRVAPTDNYKYKEQRVIAPVPNKAEELKSPFIKEVYRQAISLVRGCRTMVVIGYSFNPNDSASYWPLLKGAASKRLLVVSPDARSLVLRLKDEFPDIDWSWKAMLFKEWVLSKYPGLKPG